MFRALNPLTSRAVDILKAGKPGDTYTEDEFAAKLGTDCKPGTEGKKRIGKAIRICWSSNIRVLWKWKSALKGGGERILVCADWDNVLIESDLERRRASRSGKRINLKMLCGDDSLLTVEQTKKRNILQVVGLVVERSAHTKTLKKLTTCDVSLIAPDEKAILKLIGFSS